MEEVWKDIVGYSGRYQVSNLGRVRSSRAGGAWFLKAAADNGKGYKNTILCDGKKCKHKYIHRLVLEAFCGPALGREAAHIDGNRGNNRADNLMWASKKENESHKVRHNTLTVGERNGQAKLTKKDVEEIRSARLKPYEFNGIKKLAEKYGVCRRTIHSIRENRSWKGL